MPYDPATVAQQQSNATRSVIRPTPENLVQKLLRRGSQGLADLFFPPTASGYSAANQQFTGGFETLGSMFAPVDPETGMPNVDLGAGLPASKLDELGQALEGLLRRKPIRGRETIFATGGRTIPVRVPGGSREDLTQEAFAQGLQYARDEILNVHPQASEWGLDELAENVAKTGKQRALSGFAMERGGMTGARGAERPLSLESLLEPTETVENEILTGLPEAIQTPAAPFEINQPVRPPVTSRVLEQVRDPRVRQALRAPETAPGRGAGGVSPAEYARQRFGDVTPSTLRRAQEELKEARLEGVRAAIGASTFGEGLKDVTVLRNTLGRYDAGLVERSLAALPINDVERRALTDYAIRKRRLPDVVRASKGAVTRERMFELMDTLLRSVE